MHQGTDKIAANHPLCPLEKMAERLKSLCGIEKTNGCQKCTLILNRLGVVAAPRDGHGISMSLAEIDVHDLDQFSAVFGGAMRFILPSTVAFEHGLFFFQAEDGIRDYKVTGVQTCALPI